MSLFITIAIDSFNDKITISFALVDEKFNMTLLTFGSKGATAVFQKFKHS
jgi:hypothetical protein